MVSVLYLPFQKGYLTFILCLFVGSSSNILDFNKFYTRSPRYLTYSYKNNSKIVTFYRHILDLFATSFLRPFKAGSFYYVLLYLDCLWNLKYYRHQQKYIEVEYLADF